MMQVLIDPLSNVLYQSFYIQALYDMFGKSNVRFGSEPFRDLSTAERSSWGCLWVVREGKSEKRFFADGADETGLNENIYEWCDVYGKVNANFTKTQGREKLVSLCPSFAVRCWNPVGTMMQTVCNAVRFLVAQNFVIDKSLKKFIGRYRRLLMRAPFSEVVPGSSEDDYIFFCSTLWYNNEWNRNDEGVNLRRANFIRACQTLPGVRFEGGFVEQQGRSSRQLFEDCMAPGTYRHRDWIHNTQKSAIVFNTPAFWDCHGWKLGEYLALGKAIISTPLSNDLPFPLEHGVNIHIVEDNTESIREGVWYLISNPEYRHRLEQGAEEYWQKWGTPESVMKLMKVKDTVCSCME